ncbi:MAG: hypothetical protein KY459_05110 [Acidobacteria bacterium]|nr:hypothetical protein [Acidobacteriota bacterium]
MRAGFFRPGAFLAGFFRAGFFGAGFFRAGAFRAGFFLAGARFFAGFFLVAGFRFREVAPLDLVVARLPLDLRPCAFEGVFRADLRVVFADELVFRDFFAVLDRVPPELRVLPFLVAIELPAPVRRPLGSGLGAF